MARNPNTDRNGSNFDQAAIKAVWSKGHKIDEYDANVWRYDIYGKSMKFSDYGNTNSKHGWEIDHIIPVSRGGTDDLSNLQPLHWENNRQKGDNSPNWSSLVKN